MTRLTRYCIDGLCLQSQGCLYLPLTIPAVSGVLLLSFCVVQETKASPKHHFWFGAQNSTSWGHAILHWNIVCSVDTSKPSSWFVFTLSTYASVLYTAAGVVTAARAGQWAAQAATTSPAQLIVCRQKRRWLKRKTQQEESRLPANIIHSFICLNTRIFEIWHL